MRTKGALVIGMLACPAAAFGATGPFDLLGSMVQMVASLAVVVGLILMLVHLAKRVMKVPHGGTPFRYIRVVETRPLAPKKSLVLVEVGGEYLLLSNCGDSVSFIKQVDLVEDIEVVEDPGYAALVSARLKEKIAALTGELSLAPAKKTSGVS